MIIFLTGTPGTGKTTISKLLEQQLPAFLIDINQMVEDQKLYTGLDEQRGYKVVHIKPLCRVLKGVISDLKVNNPLDHQIIVEGHLSHLCSCADMVFVLRTHPKLLKDRLKSRDYNDAKINENIQAEALDICAFEAYQNYQDKAQEIDTSLKTPQEVVDIIKGIISGEKTSPVGNVDFSEYLLHEK